MDNTILLTILVIILTLWMLMNIGVKLFKCFILHSITWKSADVMFDVLIIASLWTLMFL